MSDTYYRELAAQRRNRIIVAASLLAVIACIAFALYNIFRDACTRSFEREPVTVVASYLQHIQSGDLARTRSCWFNEPYFSLETGCSEICLEKIVGTQYQNIDISLSEEIQTPSGRSQITATVGITCPGTAAQHTGSIILESISADVPWRHWKIVNSTFGGPISSPWCKE